MEKLLAGSVDRACHFFPLVVGSTPCWFRDYLKRKYYKSKKNNNNKRVETIVMDQDSWKNNFQPLKIQCLGA